MYAVIDIGSNTIRLVLYKVEQGEIRSVLNKKEAVGLAGYINEEHCLSARGCEILVKTLLELKEILGYINHKELFAFGTASLRNIKNTQDVLKEVKLRTGISVEILSGEEEATLDYFGARQQMPYSDGLMVDIGGGSTELAFFQQGTLCSVVSLPIGSLNMYTKFVGNLLPNKEEMENIAERTRQFLEELAPKPEEYSVEHVCGVGGSIRAMYHYVQSKKKIEVLGREYPAEHLDILMSAASGPVKKYTKTILKVAPDRLHTFTTGLVMFREITSYYQVKNIVTSSYGVREGYLFGKLQEQGILS